MVSLNRPSGSERSVHLVGRNVDETKLRRRSGLQTRDELARRFQQHKSSDDVGVDEGSGTVDRTVDVGFGRKIHHRGRPRARENTRPIAARSAMSAWTNVNRGSFVRPVEVVEAAGIGELVDDDHAVFGVGRERDERNSNR